MRVSLLLPTKDRPDRLERAVSAILAQDHDDLELIIDNGGGPIPTFDDPRVAVFERSTAAGAYTLNALAGRSTGEMLHFTADDDVILPGTLTDVVSTLEATGRPWTYGRMRYIHDGELGDLDGGFDWDVDLLRCGNTVCCPTVFWTRELWDELGPFDETLSFVFDYELWARFGVRHEPAVRSHVDYFYETWDGSTTATRRDAIQDELAGLRARWERIGFGNRAPECYVCGAHAVGVFRMRDSLLERAVCPDHARDIEETLGLRIDYHEPAA